MADEIRTAFYSAVEKKDIPEIKKILEKNPWLSPKKKHIFECLRTNNTELLLVLLQSPCTKPISNSKFRAFWAVAEKTVQENTLVVFLKHFNRVEPNIVCHLHTIAYTRNWVSLMEEASKHDIFTRVAERDMTTDDSDDETFRDELVCEVLFKKNNEALLVPITRIVFKNMPLTMRGKLVRRFKVRAAKRGWTHLLNELQTIDPASPPIVVEHLTTRIHALRSVRRSMKSNLSE